METPWKIGCTTMSVSLNAPLKEESNKQDEKAEATRGGWGRHIPLPDRTASTQL